MIRAIGFVLKLSLFAIAVLVLGNWIRWDGRTISDQVRLKMSSATRDVPAGVSKLKNWGDKVSTGIAGGGSAGGKSKRTTSNPHSTPASIARTSDRISPAERDKLRSLIQELNSDQPSNRAISHR